jgi:SAM-dependent methyltransferase
MASKLHRLASTVKQRLMSRPGEVVPSPSPPAVTAATMAFVCNVCGNRNEGVPVEHVENREFQSCRSCYSSLRMRSVMRALSMELYGKTLPLPEFPVDTSIRGLGMSDWEGYARTLAAKFDYVNTYYHAEPRLDITRVPEESVGRYRFLISSDVFEHIPVFGLDSAFRNARRILQDGGVFVFTVPFLKMAATQEHFPRLHDFRIIETGGKRYLYNRTADGAEEIFDALVFHGGEGMTLEMRMFAESDLLRRLEAAGFSSVRVCADHDPRFGIIWPMDWSVPIVARA